MRRVAGHQPRKRFGQNFLVDRACVRRIVDAIDPQPHERIVEIGPGLGALTRALLERLDHIAVIEIDRDLAARLSQEYPPARLTLYTEDALRFDFGALGSQLRIVGNLPYNISSPLLFRLLEYAAFITDVHVMLQREVVDRMIAAPASTDYGRLTVMLGRRFTIERLFRVPAGAFRPRPRVESAVVRLRPIAALRWPVHDEVVFARIVAAAFGQRRKTLRNALAGLAGEATFRCCGIDPQARGETLSVEQFARLANAVSALCAQGAQRSR
jgi:16S rRNA (adenine1518-N6/adenine1519-N6)-dimethyltransferase